jgi:hypothetical protein
MHAFLHETFLTEREKTFFFFYQPGVPMERYGVNSSRRDVWLVEKINNSQERSIGTPGENANI